MRKKPAPHLPDPTADIHDKSRSQKKRESLAMQQLGERLAVLAGTGPGRAILKRLLAAELISEDLHAALLELRAVKTHEARRRHMQYIGKIMREFDPEQLVRIAENSSGS